MKKIQNILLAVAAVLAVSCEKDAERLPFDNALEISSEGFGSGNGKAVVGGSASYWVDEEQVRVNGSTCVIAVSSEKAYVDAEGLASPYVAIYPASILADEDADLSDGGTVTVDIPSVFNYETEGGRQKLDVPMYSCNHFVDGCLYFKHLTGAITVMLTNNTNYPLEVDSIIVTNSAYQLSGSKSITLNAEGKDVAVNPAAKVGDNNRVVVLGNGKLTIPANTTGQANAVDVQVPVLPVGTENSAFTIRVRTHRAGTVGAIIFQQSQEEGNKHLDQGKIGYAMAKMDGYGTDHMTYVGLFTINARNKKVFFSKGNLQYDKLTRIWSFMDYQYSFVEYNGQDVGDDYENQETVSLFGWGTSGWDNGNVFYQPYNTNAEGSDTCGYGYGPRVANDVNYNLTGDYANADWGVFNAIINGGNRSGIWRTMTGLDGEWKYLFESRATSTINGKPNARFVKGEVAGVRCVILFPDVFVFPEGISVPSSEDINKESGWTVAYSADDWRKMELSGAVLLPMSGYRNGTKVDNTASSCYWASTHPEGNAKGHRIAIANSSINCEASGTRETGYLVRLVQDL